MLTFGASVHYLSPSQRWLEHALARSILLGEWQSPPVRLKNLVKRIPLPQEDRTHEHTRVSLLLGRRTKGNHAYCFRPFLQVLKGASCRKFLISTGKNERLRLDKSLNINGHNGNKTRQFSLSLLDSIGILIKMINKEENENGRPALQRLNRIFFVFEDLNKNSQA